MSLPLRSELFEAVFCSLVCEPHIQHVDVGLLCASEWNWAGRGGAGCRGCGIIGGVSVEERAGEGRGQRSTKPSAGPNGSSQSSEADLISVLLTDQTFSQGW